MAQQIKEVRIGQKIITVKELSVRQIWGLVSDSKAKDQKPAAKKETENNSFLDENGMDDLMGRLDTFLGLATDITREDLLDFYPSEITKIWDVFREVNGSFLGPAWKIAKLGFDRLLKRFLPLILDVMEEKIAEELEEEMKDAAKRPSSPPSVSA